MTSTNDVSYGSKLWRVGVLKLLLLWSHRLVDNRLLRELRH